MNHSTRRTPEVAALIQLVNEREDAPRALSFWLRHLHEPNANGGAHVREVTLGALWNYCPRADWLLWLAETLDVAPARQAFARQAADKANAKAEKQRAELTQVSAGRDLNHFPHFDACAAVREEIPADALPTRVLIETLSRAA